MSMPDCLMKNELEINVHNFENCIFSIVTLGNDLVIMWVEILNNISTS